MTAQKACFETSDLQDVYPSLLCKLIRGSPLFTSY
jgi:hypothetical protein